MAGTHATGFSATGLHIFCRKLILICSHKTRFATNNKTVLSYQLNHTTLSRTMAPHDIAAFYNVINYNQPRPDFEGTPYFPSLQRVPNRCGTRNVVDKDRIGRGTTDLIIYSIYQWGDLLVSSYKLLLAIGFCLAEMNERDNMAYNVLTFIA